RSSGAAPVSQPDFIVAVDRAAAEIKLAGAAVFADVKISAAGFRDRATGHDQVAAPAETSDGEPVAVRDAATAQVVSAIAGTAVTDPDFAAGDDHAVSLIDRAGTAGRTVAEGKLTATFRECAAVNVQHSDALLGDVKLVNAVQRPGIQRVNS